MDKTGLLIIFSGDMFGLQRGYNDWIRSKEGRVAVIDYQVTSLGDISERANEYRLFLFVFYKEAEE